ncbi:hypothetical protein BHE74_00019113 [Ensete ventricosum]|nr:hypothetical protein BHE74_00019113 [Ensete ventricosum]
MVETLSPTMGEEEEVHYSEANDAEVCPKCVSQEKRSLAMFEATKQKCARGMQVRRRRSLAMARPRSRSVLKKKSCYNEVTEQNVLELCKSREEEACLQQGHKAEMCLRHVGREKKKPRYDEALKQKCAQGVQVKKGRSHATTRSPSKICPKCVSREKKHYYDEAIKHKYTQGV